MCHSSDSGTSAHFMLIQNILSMALQPVVISINETRGIQQCWLQKSSLIILTVVLIHIKHATFAPIAHAPAVPPLKAEAAALLITSLKDRFSDLDMVLDSVYCIYVLIL